MGSIGSCHAGAENPGHLTNAHLANGHLANGHLVNGHLVNGHLANGHLANKCMGDIFQQTILAKFLFAFLPHFCNGSIRNCPLDTGYSVIELNKTVIEMRHFVCWPNVPPCTYWPNVRWPIVRWPSVRWPNVRCPSVWIPGSECGRVYSPSGDTPDV